MLRKPLGSSLRKTGMKRTSMAFIRVFVLAHSKHLRANIVIYDLVKGVRFTLIQEWDRSPDSIAVRPLYIRHVILKLIVLHSSLRTVTFCILPLAITPKSRSTCYPSLIHQRNRLLIRPCLPNSPLLLLWLRVAHLPAFSPSPTGAFYSRGHP